MKKGGKEEDQGSWISAERAKQYVQADSKDTRREKKGGRGKKRRRVMSQRWNLAKVEEGERCESINGWELFLWCDVAFVLLALWGCVFMHAEHHWFLVYQMRIWFAGSTVGTVVVILWLEFVFVFHWWMQTVLYWWADISISGICFRWCYLWM